jgi:hypothetical protein
MNEGEFPILYTDGTDRHIPLNVNYDAIEDVRIWASMVDEATVKEILQGVFIEVNDDYDFKETGDKK